MTSIFKDISWPETSKFEATLKDKSYLIIRKEILTTLLS